MKTIQCLGMFIVLGSSAWATEATWNSANDFSITNGNPNGAWTYGVKNPLNLGGALATFPDSGAGSFLYWIDNAHQSLGAPACAKNISGGWINGVAPGEANFHPGPGNEIATYRWTAPYAGNYHVFGKFGAGDGGAVDVYIYRNGSSLKSVNGATGDEPFDYGMALNPGDTIDFMVGNAGSFYYDSTPLHATIVLESPPRVSGTLTLGDFVGQLGGQALTVQVWDGTTLVETLTTSLDAGGAFGINPTEPTGVRILKFRTRSGLYRSQLVTLGPTPVTGLAVNLQNGDVDNSGEVDAVDIDLVIAEFGSVTAVNPDVDGSNEVDAVDIDIVIANFGGVDD